MIKKIKVALPVIVVTLAILLGGCTTHKPANNLTPDQVVTQYWMDIGKGDYTSAYDLAYHADQNQSRQAWVDAHISQWGKNGSYIKIYSFNVTGSSPANASQFEGNFSEVRFVDTNATISYMGQNSTGELRMVLVNTTDGWKIFGNY